MNTPHDNWASLYRTGGVAALVAALLFRRNIGAEISLFTGTEVVPDSAAEWFELLQKNPFVGLSLLSFFDLLNYALVGLMLMALAVMFWQARKGIVSIALGSGLMGITVSFASNASLTMLSLSQEHASANTETQRVLLESAGTSIMAAAGLPATGPCISLLFIAVAGLLLSSLLLASHRTTAIVGLVAGGCDLAYCLTVPLIGVLPTYVFLAVAGLFYMIWHLLVGRILLKQMKESK